jgi:hypothetical protein
MAGKMLLVEPTIDPSAKLHDTRLGAYCEVGARTILHEVTLGDYSYRLAELEWWDWDHEALRSALPDFRKLAVEEFLAKYEAATTSGHLPTRRRSAVS